MVPYSMLCLLPLLHVKGASMVRGMAAQSCRTHHCCPKGCSCVVAPVAGLRREVYACHILCDIWLPACDTCSRKFGEVPLCKATDVSCRRGGGVDLGELTNDPATMLRPVRSNQC